MHIKETQIPIEQRERGDKESASRFFGIKRNGLHLKIYLS